MDIQDLITAQQKSVIDSIQVTHFYNHRGFKDITVRAFFLMSPDLKALPAVIPFDVHDNSFRSLYLTQKRLSNLGLPFKLNDLTALSASAATSGGQTAKQRKPPFKCTICLKSGKRQFRTPSGCANPQIIQNGWLCNLATQGTQPHVSEVIL